MTEANQSVNPQLPSDLPPELDIDQAFQRLLPIIEDPHIARDRLYWGIEHGLVSLNLRDRAGASDSFRLSAQQFSDYYDVVHDKNGDDWHASCASARACSGATTTRSTNAQYRLQKSKRYAGRLPIRERHVTVERVESLQPNWM